MNIKARSVKSILLPRQRAGAGGRYDIVVKAHGGKIDLQSKEGEGSEFIITLPII